MDGQHPLEKAVRLGMDRTDRVTVILRCRLEDLVERLVELRDRLGFVGFTSSTSGE